MYKDPNIPMNRIDSIQFWIIIRRRNIGGDYKDPQRKFKKKCLKYI